MLTIDINCDMGEGMGNDELLMPFISSANIACGLHAGDEHTMKQTIEAALRYDVAIGAHPSFADRENFGRTQMNLAPEEVYTLMMDQLVTIDRIVKECNGRLHHVKPHGALYNMSASTPQIARTIAYAVRDFNPNLVLYGLSGSCSIIEAGAIGLRAASEVFADRTYLDDGSLSPRSQANALIEDISQSIRQVLEIVNEKSVTSVKGKKVPVVADTICIHGDGSNAVGLCRCVYQCLKESDVRIIAP